MDFFLSVKTMPSLVVHEMRDAPYGCCKKFPGDFRNQVFGDYVAPSVIDIACYNACLGLC